MNAIRISYLYKHFKKAGVCKTVCAVGKRSELNRNTPLHVHEVIMAGGKRSPTGLFHNKW